MAVKIRLRREGKRKQPFYRVVVADVRSPRDGRFIDDLGYYQPLRDPSEISIDSERALYWLRNGAQPSDAVRKLLRIEGIWEEFKPGDPGRDRSAKHAAEAEARAERERAAAAEVEASRAPASDDLPPVEVVGEGDAAATTEADTPPRAPDEDAPAGDDDAGAADTPTATDGEEETSS